MFSHFVKSALPRCEFTFTYTAWQHTRGWCGASTNLDQARTLLQLIVDRGFISPGHANVELFKRGTTCSYGPLGSELRENVLHQWWRSMTGSRQQVFEINTPSSSGSPDIVAGRWGHLRIVEPDDVRNVLNETELSREQLVHSVRMFLQRSPLLRTNLIQGALEQFVPLFELVNRKLPFGIAETGRCFQPSQDGSAGEGSSINTHSICVFPEGQTCQTLNEVTHGSLVWFCSPRTSSQWLDHWARQRLKWWRKFALVPSDFSSSDVSQDELEEVASRGVKIYYKFPWGQEALEVLSSRGDCELLQMHKGVRSKFQSRDGQKSVAHIVSITGNIDRGLLAFLSNSLQLHNREDIKQKLHQRKVLKLHPLLAPVKVALGIGRGATMELRQVCEGLWQELKEAKISAWPGYLETSPVPMEQLNSKYDEMGVLFTAVISENTLESGLLQVRSRDTTIKETMHISELNNFLSRYISAADNM
ncbi:DNA polymerase subunit gamma-2, mitochondrial isoform X5 [Syngnathoides biaculeatus]|uniref:DNA polymerase subunit gamma-2, mitochondrial isoform X5 n=1 Tax=Syngnathoides biaculeatus TaxID=300417 RepID=UPI002ADD9F13|nr:DNA polymerase subunit gamma-2, mitochondrial isoform X5 [Syngnathoides biaculeatus]